MSTEIKKDGAKPSEADQFSFTQDLPGEIDALLTRVKGRRLQQPLEADEPIKKDSQEPPSKDR